MTFTRGSANKATHSFIKVDFSAKVQTIFDHECCFMDGVNRDWEGEIENGGDIVTIRGFGDITWSTYSPDSTTITYSTLSESSLDLVIDTFKYCAFKLDDVDAAQVDIEVLDGYGERAGVSGRDLVDTHLSTGIAAAVPADNVMGATTLGSVIQLTKDSIYPVFCDLFAILKDSKVFGATKQRPWTVVQPQLESLMKQAPEFTHASDMGDEVIRNGVIGEFAGFEVKTTTNYGITAASGGNDSYYTVLAGVNLAYSFAMQVNEMEDIRLEGAFADGRRGLMVYGSKAVAPQGLAKLICKR
jgi:hypothetical protein